MKIAVVHSFYSSAQPSGENVVVEDQVAALREYGHEVLLIARYTDQDEMDPLYRARAAIRTTTGYGKNPAEALRDFQPDIVHLHNTFPNWGTRWLSRWRTRTVATLHNYRTVCAAGTLFRDGQECTECLATRALPAIRHKCYRGSTFATTPLALATLRGGTHHRLLQLPAAIITLNPQMRQVLESASQRRDIHVVPNFVLGPTKSLVEIDREWLFVGRLTAEKGLRELLLRWPIGRPLDVIGDGELRIPLMRKYRTRPEITFLGPQPRESVIGNMGRYRGLIVPSLCREGLPTVILEALARGVPSLLSSTIAATPSLVASGAAVELPDGDSQEIDAALNALDQPSFRQNARRVHQADFSPGRWLTEVDQIYREVMSAL